MDIHEREKRIEGTLRRLAQKTDISDNNKATILRTVDYNYARGVSAGRVQKYLLTLAPIAVFLGKDFELANKDDILRVIGQIERQQWSPHTKHDFKTILKAFYKWLRGMDDYPPEVKWVKTTVRGTTKKLPEDLLTGEEIIKLIRSAYRPRDRAFIATLAESGCRVGELGGLRIKDVQFDGYGAILIVDGKTGMRRVRVIAAAPFLSTWLNLHPQADNRDAFLWVTKVQDKSIRYSGLLSMMRKTAKRAGIRKRTNFHNFRHSRASFLANHLTSAQMNEFFGWTQGSKMAGVYVHLSGKNVDNALLGIYGIKAEDNREREFIKPRICILCSHWNPFVALVCEKCLRPLEIEGENGSHNSGTETKIA